MNFVILIGNCTSGDSSPQATAETPIWTAAWAAATFIPIYIISKYIIGLNSPILVSAFATVPLGYFSHKYFEVETPLGNYIDKLIGSQPNVQNSQITTWIYI